MANEPSSLKDTGCEYSPSCFTCPLPMCKYDLPGPVEVHVRNQGICDARKGGMSVKETAKRFGVSLRTVHRALRASIPGYAKGGMTLECPYCHGYGCGECSGSGNYRGQGCDCLRQRPHNDCVCTCHE